MFLTSTSSVLENRPFLTFAAYGCFHAFGARGHTCGENADRLSAARPRPPRQWPGRKGLAREAGKFTFCIWRLREMSTSTRIVAR